MAYHKTFLKRLKRIQTEQEKYYCDPATIQSASIYGNLCKIFYDICMLADF